MVAKVQKWGNSQGLRLARKILEEAHVAVGDEVDISVRDGVIMVTPLRRVRGKYSLEDIITRIPKGYHAEKEDFGAPVGKEVW